MPPKLRPSVAAIFNPSKATSIGSPLEAMDKQVDLGPTVPSRGAQKIHLGKTLAENGIKDGSKLRILEKFGPEEVDAALGRETYFHNKPHEKSVTLPDALSDARVSNTVDKMEKILDPFSRKRARKLFREIEGQLVPVANDEQVDLRLPENQHFYTSPEQWRKMTAAKAKRIYARENVSAAERQMALATREMFRALEANPTLTGCEGSRFHKLIEASDEDGIINPYVAGAHEAGRSFLGSFPAEILIADFPLTFTVSHDWGALLNRDDVEGAEWRLPGDVTAVELEIQKHRLIAIWFAEDGNPDTCYIYAHVGRDRPAWALYFIGTYQNGRFGWDASAPESLGFNHLPPLAEIVLRQTRALCIMLDAEVAVADVVRAPHKLNHERQKRGKPMLLDYHVVNLAHRTRVAPRLPDGDAHEPKFRKRLHFVRGHWRHFESHKTWIKWHLRGNPDLGFIDKEYRV